MHKGRFSPYELTARVYMGLFTYPNWVRQSYTISQVGFTFWQGVDASLITVNPPYTSYRQPSLEASPLELAIAAYVQQLHGQDLYVGWHLILQSDGVNCRMSDQVWLGGATQMNAAVAAYTPSSFLGWNTDNGVNNTLKAGATIGCRALDYEPVPY